MWANGARTDSLLFLRQFTATIANDLEAEVNRQAERESNPRVARISKLLARCYFKLGEWEAELRPDWTLVSPMSSLKNFPRSFVCIGSAEHRHIKLISTRYPLRWRMVQGLAHMGSGQLQCHQHSESPKSNARYSWRSTCSTCSPGNHRFGSSPSMGPPWFTLRLGFFRSISLRSEEALQDTLRLLTLWFEYGAHDDVSQAINGGFRMVDVDTWLDVIPQVFKCGRFLSISDLRFR